MSCAAVWPQADKSWSPTSIEKKRIAPLRFGRTDALGACSWPVMPLTSCRPP
jgi:hypothetical protein